MENNQSYQQSQYPNGYVEMTAHVILLIFTFGIYHLYWIYKMTKLGNKKNAAEIRNATNNLLLCLFVPFFSVYWYYKTFDILEIGDKENKDFRTVMIVLSFISPLVCSIVFQDKINKKSVQNAIDPIQELKKYNELLEMNAITQAEFDAKKKELLNL